METFITKIIAEGRVTIPKAVREKLLLDEGDVVEVQVRRVKLVIQ